MKYLVSLFIDSGAAFVLRTYSIWLVLALVLNSESNFIIAIES